MANLETNCYDNIIFEPKLLVRLGVLGIVCRLHFLQRLMQFRALHARKAAHKRRQASDTRGRSKQETMSPRLKRRRGSCASQACTRTRGGRTSSAAALPTSSTTATTTTNRACILLLASARGMRRSGIHVRAGVIPPCPVLAARSSSLTFPASRGRDKVARERNASLSRV